MDLAIDFLEQVSGGILYISEVAKVVFVIHKQVFSKEN